MAPIERAARVICEHRGIDPDYLEPGDAYGIDEYLANGDPAHFKWREFVELARAVVASMRDPSEAMRNAASDAEPTSSPGEWSYPEDMAVAQWQAMVDAALAEEGPADGTE